MTPKCPLPGSQFCACQAYESSNADELSVPAGARVRVLETSDRGWWLCRCAGVGRARGAQGGGGRQDPAGAKPRPLCRFGGRSGLLPAVLLRPEGLGALLSGSGLRRKGSEEDKVGEAQCSPEISQATTLPPTVPARPLLSAIRSRCCTVTRRALARKDPLEGV